jgi:hypothetical protein
MWLISHITWNNPRTLSDAQKNQVMDLLKTGYFIIYTHNRNHLASHVINFSDWALTGKWGFWDHVLMNFEGTTNGFELIQSIGDTGVAEATFDSVFGDVDAVCLMQSANLHPDDWNAMLVQAKADLGKPYDALFDPSQNKTLSCIELIRDCLMKIPTYAEDFALFEADVKKYGEITPQMLYDNPEFTNVLEIRVP